MTTVHRRTLLTGERIFRVGQHWFGWPLFWQGLFYAELLIVTSVILWQESFAWKELVPFTIVALILGSWYGISVIVDILFWYRHPLITQGYLAIGLGLGFVTIQLHWLCWFLLFGLCAQLCMLSARLWKIPSLLILTALSIRQVVIAGGTNYGSLLTLVGFSFISLLVALHLEDLSLRNLEKDQLVSQLEATRQELATASQQAGAAQERERLAYEIHDTLAQGFTSILMHAEAAERLLPVEGARSIFHLHQIGKIAREQITEARRLMWALQPESLERASLPDVLSHLCHIWSQEHGIAADTTMIGPRRLLRPEIEVILLRTAQEGLANVSKHAQASQVTVTLSYLDDVVVLDIQDDGVGFDPEQLLQPNLLQAQITHGFGLKALHERAERLGGILSLESTLGEGTTLAMTLPALPACSEGGRESQSIRQAAWEDTR